MASASCQTSASELALARWDVFLSFHGPDTRHNFTNHLYSALVRHGLRTFMNDLELRKGDAISEAFVHAIKESRTYIVVFSENYASSRSCLDELVEIYNCYETTEKLVVPLYYYIDTSAVRHQKRSFEYAFQEHKIHYGTDTLHKWRSTLEKVAKLKGYHLLENEYQTDVINQVVGRVLLEINPKTLNVAKYPVGLESRVEDITRLLTSDTFSVTRIGLHGMGGVGKTTLAKALYNQNYQRFQGSCFLENVGEVSRTERGLVSLQQQLMNDILKYKNIKIDNVHQGITLIKDKICSIKVLIVIDDLDNPKPLKYLGPLALGSKIIITTRNEDLLDSIGVEAKYPVNGLGDVEARQLFTQHAFGDANISDTFMELSEEILKHAGGLPLALTSYGSRLHNQSEEGWKLFIDALKQASITDVEERLLISFEALELVDPMLQDIFLDISCFFIGWKKEEVVKIMETYYTFISYYIDILRKRCLLTVNNKDELGMHDLLRDMGRKIACNNSPHDPGKHSRLWISKDICEVLKQHMGTEAIEGIVPSYQNVLEEVSFPTETFKRMSTLRFLYLRDIELYGSFEQIFEDLRWLCWDFCPLECLPSDFYPQKLVILALRHSKIRTMWEPNMVTEVFLNLTTLDMSYSVDLTATPDFTNLPCLETLSFEGCESLKEVHVSIGSLLRLVSLNLCGCVNLKSVPDSICNLSTLKSLNIGGCSGLEALPIELGNIESLKELDAWGLNVSILPDSIQRRSKLVELNLSDNKYVETPSLSASTSPSTRWDVYLSFRGPDTRYRFTDCLYHALNRTGIRTFRDDPKLLSEEIISDSLHQAIQESKTYIIVFSENYASSKWCLDELIEILNCHQTTERLVIPVFYHIDPSVVLHQTRSFEKAFQIHETRYAGEIEKVSNWRTALKKLAYFSGYHVSELRPQAHIIDEIVDVILRKINPKTPYVAKYPVGLTSRVKDITAALLSSGAEGVINVGLYGLSGVGKTTLAKSLFNKLLLERSFTGSCFLANVREVSGTAKGLLTLQQQLIDDILIGKKRVEIHNVDEGILFIRDRMCSAKVLLLIDDIDDHKQFKSLVGPFSSGSVVIITTRDEQILDKIKVELKCRYRVNQLDDAESRALFTQHVFGNAEPDSALMVLSKDILQRASGLPLALEVFGSYLSTESEEGWRAFIDKLQKVPNTTVQESLMISLDALESKNPTLKKIFIDIACFFIGWEKQDVVKIMETYYSDVDHNIGILKKRCLLTINNRLELRMHNMLQDMGRKIVHDESLHEPGKFSGLWLSTDIREMLQKHEGTEAIESIILPNLYYQDSLDRVSISAETFKTMSELRFLFLKNVTLTGSFRQTFKNLRWLCWDSYHLEHLPSEFHPQNLVTLELPNSKMKTLWESNMVPRDFEKLKTLNMSFSRNLTTTPDFTKFLYLETLNLKCCESLREVHVSVGSLVRLVSLDLHGCVKLRSLPKTLCNLRALKVLNIGQCSSLEALPIDLGNIVSLTELKAYELTICELPDSIGRLSELVELNLSYNEHLQSLPYTIRALRSLEKLYLTYCWNLLAIPELPSNLKWIMADGCVSMERLPNLSNLKKLEKLNLTDCSSLTEIIGLEELTSLRELHLVGCQSSLLAHTFQEHLFQVYIGFGHEIIICTDFPDWIGQSNIRGSTVSLELLPNVSHNFLGMILCFKSFKNSFISYFVKNTIKDFVWSGQSYKSYHTSLMVILPKSIFSISDGDRRIELTADAEICGVYLMHKNGFDSTIVNVERSLPSKQLKHLESGNS